MSLATGAAPAFKVLGFIRPTHIKERYGFEAARALTLSVDKVMPAAALRLPEMARDLAARRRVIAFAGVPALANRSMK